MNQDQIRLAANATLDRRRAMVDGQVRTFDVTDQRVLDQFYRVPREVFLPAALAPLAYSDAPIVLPLSGGEEDGRAMLQPMFLAKLLQGATLALGQKVLVVAGGSGYPAALVAGLTGAVVTLESDAGLTEQAGRLLSALGYGDAAQAVTGPLEAGYPKAGPFDRIIVAGAVESGLDMLFQQIAPGGSLLAVTTVGSQSSRRAGKATRFDKVGGDISPRALFDATVPVLAAFRQPAAFVF